ncbi:hypothetical protein [Vibrio sp. 10N.222.52.B7]|uniref:hypothetical protein n=1 Tax=Vibrio sp. 10N.222.52.B7 TaxID=3229629 RepID=UPI0038B55426
MKKMIASLLSLSVVACGGSDGDNSNGNGENDSLKYLTPPKVGYQTFDRVQGNTRTAYSSGDINQYEHINPDTGVGIPVNPSCKVDEDGINECDIVEPDILRVFDINKKYSLVQIDNATIDYEDVKYVGRYAFIQDKLTGELHPILRDGKLQALWLTDEFASVNSTNKVAYNDSLYYIEHTGEGETWRPYKLLQHNLNEETGFFEVSEVYIADDGKEIADYAVDKDNNILLLIGDVGRGDPSDNYVEYISAIGGRGIIPHEENINIKSVMNGDIYIWTSVNYMPQDLKVSFNESGVELSESQFTYMPRGGVSRGNYIMAFEPERCIVYEIDDYSVSEVADTYFGQRINSRDSIVASQDYLMCTRAEIDDSTRGLIFDTRNGSNHAFDMNFIHGHWDDGYQLSVAIATQYNEFKLVEEYRPDGAGSSVFTEHYYNVDTGEEYEIALNGERMSLKVFSYLEKETD